MRVEGVQTARSAPQVNMVVKNVGDYYPSWPQTSAAMGETDGQADVLSARRLGYLYNGRKSGASLGETIQLNLCNGRAVGVDVCFEGVDEHGPAGPVVMKKVVPPRPSPLPRANRPRAHILPLFTPDDVCVYAQACVVVIRTRRVSSGSRKPCCVGTPTSTWRRTPRVSPMASSPRWWSGSLP